jgi:hypothetical protein
LYKTEQWGNAGSRVDRALQEFDGLKDKMVEIKGFKYFV